MKKIHSVSIIIGVIISFSLAFFISSFTAEDPEPAAQLNHYNTPEEAVEMELNVQEYRLMESNDTYMCLCDAGVNDYSCQYLIKDENGWSVVTDYMFENVVFGKMARDTKYFIYIREYMGKYMIYVSQPYYSIDDYGLLTVADSLNTEFVETEYATLYMEHYWYWCLDEIPKGYEISIDGEVIYSKK